MAFDFGVSWARTLLVTVSCLLSVPGLAAEDFAIVKDSVSVEYASGMARRESSESIKVQVERVTTTFREHDREIDIFFGAVEKVLSDHAIKEDWQNVIPDGPYVRIRVLLNGRRIMLSSAHTVFERDGRSVVTDRGVEALNGRSRTEVLAQQSDSLRQHRIAFEKILSLVGERLNRKIH